MYIEKIKNFTDMYKSDFNVLDLLYSTLNQLNTYVMNSVKNEIKGATGANLKALESEITLTEEVFVNRKR